MVYYVDRGALLLIQGALLKAWLGKLGLLPRDMNPTSSVERVSAVEEFLMKLRRLKHTSAIKISLPEMDKGAWHLHIALLRRSSKKLLHTDNYSTFVMIFDLRALERSVYRMENRATYFASTTGSEARCVAHPI